MHRVQPGFVLGDRYRLERRLASGGMADVWVGDDEVLQRQVAVKIMRADPEHEDLFRRRFRDEALHAAALMHTNITTVFDYGEDDTLTFLVMELVEGEPLSTVVRTRGALPPDEVRSIIGQAALALGVAHNAGVVHRDVKPANMILRPDGLVKLTDFGIARAVDAAGMTRIGDLVGTPHYVSPEQAQGLAATGASDLYSLGVVAHELLTGHRPFDKGTPVATAIAHVQEQPPPLPDEVPEAIRYLVEDLLAKDPDNRPPNAMAVAVRLGLADAELSGLAMGLALAVDGDAHVHEPAAVDPDANTDADGGVPTVRSALPRLSD